MTDTTSKRGFPAAMKFKVGDPVIFVDKAGNRLSGTIKVPRPYRLAGFYSCHFPEAPKEEQRQIVHEDFLEGAEFHD